MPIIVNFEIPFYFIIIVKTKTYFKQIDDTLYKFILRNINLLKDIIDNIKYCPLEHISSI